MYFMYGYVRNGRPFVKTVEVSNDTDIEKYTDELRRQYPSIVGPVYAYTEADAIVRFNDLVQTGREIYSCKKSSAVM